MISVAICTYNGEKYIKEQIESIINQTMEPDEIVICDDRSTDNTIRIVKQVLNTWEGTSKIIINKNNMGCTKNFENAISHCCGDIIFLSDQDDVWDFEKISKVCNIFYQDDQTIMVFHDAILVDRNLKTICESNWDMSGFDRTAFYEKNYRILLDHNIVQGSACAFKRDLYDKAKPFPKEAVHDEWLALVAISIGKVIPYNEKLMKYRQWEANLIGGQLHSFSQKIKLWLFNSRNKANEHFKRLNYRYSIFYEYLSRGYDTHNVFNVSMVDYCDFLQKRLDCINKKKIVIFYLYKKYSNTFLDIKILFKNLLEDILSLCYTNSRH